MPEFKKNTDFQLKPKMGRGHKGPNYAYKPKWVGALISGISSVANTFIQAKAGQAQKQAEQQAINDEAAAAPAAAPVKKHAQDGWRPMMMKPNSRAARAAKAQIKAIDAETEGKGKKARRLQKKADRLSTIGATLKPKNIDRRLSRAARKYTKKTGEAPYTALIGNNAAGKKYRKLYKKSAKKYNQGPSGGRKDTWTGTGKATSKLK